MHAVAAAPYLVAEILRVDGERIGVRHLEYRGDAAHHRAARSGFEVLLVGLTRFAEMHLGVDHAGQDVQALAIDDFARAGGAERTDFGDSPTRNTDVADALAVLVDDGAGF